MTWQGGQDNRTETKNERPLNNMVSNPNLKFHSKFDTSKHQGSVLISQTFNYEVFQSSEPTRLDA